MLKPLTLAVFTALACQFAFGAPLPAERTLTDLKGRSMAVSITAVEGTKITALRTSDAYKLIIDAATLSVADQEFVKSLTEEPKEAEAPHPAAAKELTNLDELLASVGGSYDAIFPILEKKQAALIGKPAPDFEFENASGKKLKLSDLKGSTVIIVMISKAGYAVREPNHMDLLQSFSGAAAKIDSAGAKLVFVSNTQFPDDYTPTESELPASECKELQAGYGESKDCIAGMAYCGRGNIISYQWGVSTMPSCFVIDRGGKVARTSNSFGGPSERATKVIEAAISMK